MPVSQIACLMIALGSCTGPRSETTRIPDRVPACLNEECESAVIELQHATAADVVKTLDELLAASRRLFAQRMGPPSCVLYPPGAHPAELDSSTRFVACTGSNAIWIQAPPDDLPRIRELIARMDGACLEDQPTHIRERR